MPKNTSLSALYLELVDNGYILTIDTKEKEEKLVFASSRQVVSYIKALLKNDS